MMKLIEDISKMSRSSKNAFSAALIIIAIIMMYQQIVAPQAAHLFAEQRREIIVDNTAKKSRIISDRISVKREKFEKLKEQFSLLQSTLFAPDEVKEFFSDLQAVSEEAGCKVYSLNLITAALVPDKKQSRDTSGIVANSAKLSVIGVYSDIINLIESLQARTQKVMINSVQMETLDYDSSQAKCVITITIYTIKDKEVAV